MNRNFDSMSVGEVASALGVTPPTVRSYVLRGLLKPDSVSVAGRCNFYEFNRETVEDFVKSCTTGEYYYGEQLVSTIDVATYLGVALHIVYGYIDRGLLKPDVILPATSNGHRGRRRFRDSTVRNFAKRRKQVNEGIAVGG